MSTVNAGLHLPRSTPENEGVSSKSILNLLDAIEASGIEFHHLTIARHGKVIATGSWAPYKHEFPHMTHSLTKLFTNTAVGMVCDEGLLSLNSRVISFFPAEVPDDVGDNLKEMRVRDLITMRCGHEHLISGNKWRPIKTSWVAEFFKEPIKYVPGEHFQYTSATSYILSAIVQKVTGLTVHQYLKKNFFLPLNIEGEYWDICPHGINPGGNGLTIRNEDCVKIGLMYLNRGEYSGKRYVSEKWVQEAMVDSCKLNPDSGYGFHLSNENGFISSGGIFGQTIVLLPNHDMVLAINAAHHDNRPNALDKKMRLLIEDTLLKGVCEGALQPNVGDQNKLNCRLDQLSITTIAGSNHSFAEQHFNGEYEVENSADKISLVSFMFDDDKCTFGLRDDRGFHSIVCGANDWEYGSSSMTGYYLHHQYQPDCAPIAGRGWWLDANTYVMKWAWVNMTFVDTVVCKFDEQKVAIKRTVNVNTQDIERPEFKAIKW